MTEIIKANTDNIAECHPGQTYKIAIKKTSSSPATVITESSTEFTQSSADENSLISTEFVIIIVVVTVVIDVMLALVCFRRLKP